MNSELKKIDEITVTVFFIGKIKYAPGTFGSIAALTILFLPGYMIWYSSLIFALVLSIIGFNSIKTYENVKGFDHSSIVIDEVIGMLIALSNPYLILTPFWIIISLGIFRIFDILKPFPINLLNIRKGAFFVIADDVAAGIFTLVIVHIFQLGYRILPFFISFLEKY